MYKRQGHTVVNKTLSRVQSNFWWPGISVDVERFVKECAQCQEAQLGTQQNAPVQSLTTAGKPNERVHMDLFVPLGTRLVSGNKLILDFTDAFTKYTELEPILNKEATTVARAFFERWIYTFGVPTVSERDKKFLNEVMQDLTQ